MKDDVQDVFGVLEDLLAEALRAIEGIEGSSEVPGAPSRRPTRGAGAPTLDTDQLSRILADLKDKLAAGDLDGASAAMGMIESGLPAAYKSEVEKIRELIEAYDFEEAGGVADLLLGQLRGG